MSPHANPSQTRCDERCRLVRVGAAGEHHRQRRQRLGLRELLPERLPEVRKPVRGAALIGAARSTVTACANRPIATTVGQSVPGSVIGARAAFAPNTRPSQQPEQSILGLRRHEHDLFATAGGHARTIRHRGSEYARRIRAASRSSSMTSSVHRAGEFGRSRWIGRDEA